MMWMMLSMERVVVRIIIGLAELVVLMQLVVKMLVLLVMEVNM